MPPARRLPRPVGLLTALLLAVIALPATAGDPRLSHQLLRPGAGGRQRVDLRALHPGVRYPPRLVGRALKLYIGVFVAALIGFMGRLAPADTPDVRFGLGSAALFAAIATQFVIATNMPDTSTLTVPDLICIVTIFYVFRARLHSGVALLLNHHRRAPFARRLDLVGWRFSPAVTSSSV